MHRRTLGIVAALLAVYLIWGSTYLAIYFAVLEMPPFLMAAGRWLVAGAIIYAWRRLAGDPRPTWRQVRSAAVIGVALILGGNGLVTWAEQWVPSALTALLIAIVPMWIALLLWMRTRERPTPRVGLGILLGFAGVATLFAPTIVASVEGSPALLLGALGILVATISWASGSIYSRTAELPKSTMMGVGVEMLAGAAALAIVGLATGEAARLDLGAVTARGWLSVAFLTFFGSIVGFSAYIWLLRQVSPTLVATYAFVNPIVAVVLGIVFAGETFTPLTIAASALIVLGVALVVTAPKPATDPPKAPAADA